MSETLGEAVLVLRTDDSGLDAGMSKARTGADGVGMAFDKATTSAGTTSQALIKTGQAATTSGAQFKKASGEVTAASGAQRAGLQQLGMQLGDVSTMYALGARPSQIFASQIGQVTQAVQLMTGGTSKAAAFLGGPWGIATILAMQVLGPFIGRLFETAAAAEEMSKRLSDAAEGADAFGDAQSLLGKMVDLTTGKLKSQNEVLRASIRLQAMLAQEQARTERDAAGKAIRAQALAKSSQAFGGSYMGPGSQGGGAISYDNAPEVRSISKALLEGNIGVDQAIRQITDLGKAGKVSADVMGSLRSQYLEFAQAAAKGEASQSILDFLDGKGLDPRLVPYAKPGKPKKGPKDRSEQLLERYQNELARLLDDQLGLTSQLTADVRLRAGIAHDRIDAETAGYKAELESRVRQKELTDAQALALLNARKANAEDEHALVNRKLDAELRDQEAALSRDAVAARLFVLQGELANARTQGDRRRIQLEMLDVETESLRSAIERDLLSKDLTEADRSILEARLGRLQAERGQRATAIEQQTAGPWTQWLKSLPQTAGEIDEAFQAAAANGIDDFNRGVAEAIANGESLGDMWDQVRKRFLANLIEMELRWAESQLFKAGGGGGGFLGLLGSAIGGALGPGASGGAAHGVSESVSGAIGGMALNNGGGRAGGGTVSPGNYYDVNEYSTAPGIFIPLSPGIIQPPSAGYAAPDARRGGAGGPNYLHVSVSGARGNREIEAMVQSGVRQGIAGYDRVVGERVTEHLARRG